ncbi:MAG: transcription termination/antitermination protein NusG [Candidatus Alcyoniella australis]|nr:transcription termination/antitermination protein NusG [Candidatus Alcyoniella australis]
MAKHWYVVHTYSGYEKKAKLALEERFKNAGCLEMLEEVLIPTEKVVEGERSAKRTIRRKFFPGYILVKMELNDDTWHLVKSTPRVTGFVGGAHNPPTVSDEEVQKIVSQISEGTLKSPSRIEFEKGETIRVKHGPFATFQGIVDDVNADKGKLKVMISIFGRLTPVELEFKQVEKT